MKNYDLLQGLAEKHNNAVMFKLMQAEIIEALNLGYSAKDIWQKLHVDKKFLGSYTTFLSYVRKSKNNTKKPL